jgi:hypothetical protein
MTNYTKRVKSRMRVNPPTSYAEAVSSTLRKIQIKVEIQWDGTNWVDESQYVLTVQGSVELSGSLGEASSAQIDVEVDNTTGRFTPTNQSSPIYGYFNIRTPIRVSVGMGTGYYVRIFTGYIKTFQPNLKSAMCNFHCFDNLRFILNKESPYNVVYLDQRIDQLIKVLLDYTGVPEYVLDESTQTVNGAWFEGNKLAHPLINDLTIAERGRSFFDQYGVFRFWNKDRLHHQKPVIRITIDDYLLDIDYQIAEHEMKNRVVVEATPRGAQGLQQVWSNIDPELADIGSDSLVYLPEKGQQSAWIQLEDPASGWITPLPIVDYTANSEIDGTGDDLTDQIEVTTFNSYATSAFITVRNNAEVPVYFTKFSVRANPIKIYKYIRVIAKDQFSMDAYGVKEVKYENEFIDSESQANNIAYEELQRWKSALNNYNITIRGVPYIYTGDVIELETSEGEFENFMINSINWTLDNSGQFEQTINLVNPIKIPVDQQISAKMRIQ